MASNEDETPPAPKSAEDRKAASALANLDASADDNTAAAAAEVDQEAIHKAMKGLPANSATLSGAAGSAAKHTKGGAATKKAVKLDPEDVALVVDQLDLTKARATELLKQHDGSAVAVLRMFAAGHQE